MKMIPPEFLIIPYQLIEDEIITPLDERVYGIIYWLTRLKGEKCTASNPTLASLCQTTPTSLGNSLTRLERGGYIKRSYFGEKRKNRKEIIPLIVFTKVSLKSDTPKKVSSGSDTVSSASDTRYHQEVNRRRAVKKSSKEDSSEPSSQSSLIPEVIKLFESINPTCKTYYGNATQRNACQFLIEEYGFEKIKYTVENVLPKTNEIEFIPTITTPNQLKESWARLEAGIKKYKSKLENKGRGIA